MSKGRYVAFDAGNCESEMFETFEQAEKWLQECDEEGVSIEAMEGYSYIAKITHRSHFEVTDRKADYHQHTDTCPKYCDKEEWPYDSEYDEVGQISYLPIDEEPRDD